MSSHDRCGGAPGAFRFFVVLLSGLLFSGAAVAQLNLVTNGTFEGGFVPDGSCDLVEPDADQLPNSWSCVETFSSGIQEPSLITRWAGNGPTLPGSSALNVLRRDLCHLSGDWTTVEQVIAADVSTCYSLSLSMDVMLVPLVGLHSHNLGGSGHAAGPCDPSGYEYPMTVKIDYTRADGTTACWQYGWYQYPTTLASRTDQGCISGFDNLNAAPNPLLSRQIGTNVWVPNLFNLLNVLPGVKTIQRIRVGGSGWSFQGVVDNVQILCEDPCTQSPMPQCPGPCPPGQVCRPDNQNGICRCKLDTCENSLFPQCNGPCPDGMACMPDMLGGACRCETLPCEQGPYPQCNGPCPSPLVCVADPLGGPCRCEPPPCDQTAPACNGTCPSGQQCLANGTGGCACEPLPCDQTAPACNGTCPSGQQCLANGTGGCACEPLPCEQSGWPSCNGPCPTGQFCAANATGCLCVGHTCQTSPYPACNGPCPPDQECLPSATGLCDCQPVPCERSSYPACGGPCPPGQGCVSNGAGGCFCETLRCELSPYPECGGPCPAGQRCVPGAGGACACEPLPCEQSGWPSCNGPCPTGQFCAANATGCLCVGHTCQTSPYPACNGPCPPDQECLPSATGLCDCQPVPCERSSYPTCGGPCPPGQRCIAGAGNACICETIPCEQGPYPECNGPCPPGQQCAVGTAGACECVVLSCEQTFPQCGGPCPPGQRCVTDTAGNQCVCETIPCEQGPFPECGGPCPQGQVCAPQTTGQCACVTLDATIYKADWPDYAPSGMPDFEQRHSFLNPLWPPVNGRTACGPAAMLDSFWWFDSEMECDSHHTRGDAAEQEPNNACTQAGTLGETPALPGNLPAVVPPDGDWYSFVVPPGGTNQCSVIVSTAALAAAGDADTRLSLYDGCDAAGTPGNLLASNDDTPWGRQAEISPLTTPLQTLPPGRYWVHVQLGATGAAGRYTLTLGLDCYPLLRRWIQQSPDDHSPYNVEQLIVSFWTCANTDDQSGGGRWKGTTLADMKSCADSWLQAQNLDQNYTRQVVRRPAFPEVAREIERSEDIVLLLGFYWQTGPATWARCGGHYVTAAGVDRANATITVSDPYYNNAEPPASGGNGGPGRVRGPGHGNHAPGLPPYPDHDDAVNLSHDRYATGPSMVGPAVSLWSLVGYATPGRPTTCEDVINFCYGMEYGQNPPEYPATQYPCPGPATPISVEVEAMVDVSPVQTPVCILLDPAVAWPDNLRVTKGACDPAQATLFSYDVIRGKRCGLGFSGLPAVSDLGHVTCLYDNVARDRFDETSPDDDLCFGPWFYLVRQSGDLNYGSAQPGGEPELPSSGGCP